MMYKMFTVYDSKACAYMTPFFQPEKGQAARLFTDAVRDPETLLGKHPEDFTLFYVGEFDTDTATVIPVVPHETCLNGVQVRRVEGE